MSHSRLSGAQTFLITCPSDVRLVDLYAAAVQSTFLPHTSDAINSPRESVLNFASRVRRDFVNAKKVVDCASLA